MPASGTPAFTALQTESQNQKGNVSASFNPSTQQTSYTPTVITDSNIREGTIPSLNATASNLGISNPNVSGANSFNQSNGGNTETKTGTGADTTENPYTALYKGIMGDTGTDQVSTDELALIKGMQVNADALSQAQLGAISAGYSARRQMLQQSQGSETAKIANALTLSGSSRYAPVSSSGIMTAKENSDIQALTTLDNEETAAKASVYKAQQEQDYELMSKSMDVLQKARDNKIAMATAIATQMKDYNNYLLEVDKFNHQTAQDKTLNEQKAEQLKQGKYEFRDMKDMLGNTIGTQVFDKSTGKPVSSVSAPGSGTQAPGSAGLVNPVQVDPSTGVPNQTQQESFLKSLPPPMASLVSALANYTADPKNISYKNRTQLMEYVHTFDPTYDENQYTVRHNTIMSYTSGSDHKNIVSLNTAINHTGELARDFKGLDNASITKYNTIKNWWQSNVGKGDITKVLNDLNALGGELAKTYKGTAGTDQEIANIEKGINANSSPAQVKAFIESSMNLLGGRVTALEDTFTTAVGKPFPRPLINPDTQRVLSGLRDSGYDIQVRGIGYSDPTAYVKSSPENKTNFQNTANKLHTLFPDRSFTSDEIMQAVNAQ